MAVRLNMHRIVAALWHWIIGVWYIIAFAYVFWIESIHKIIEYLVILINLIPEVLRAQYSILAVE